MQAGKWQAAARNKNRKEAQSSVRDAKNARCKDVSVDGCEISHWRSALVQVREIEREKRLI